MLRAHVGEEGSGNDPWDSEHDLVLVAWEMQPSADMPVTLQPS